MPEVHTVDHENNDDTEAENAEEDQILPVENTAVAF